MPNDLFTCVVVCLKLNKTLITGMVVAHSPEQQVLVNAAKQPHDFHKTIANAF